MSIFGEAYGMICGGRYIFLYSYSVFLAPFVEKDFHVIELFLHLCNKSSDGVCVGLFLDYSVPQII